MSEKLKELLARELSIDPADVTPDAQLVSDLGINSIELADMLLICEDEFGVSISDDDAHKFLTVGDLTNYLEEHAK